MGGLTRTGRWDEDDLVAPAHPAGRTAGRALALIWLFYLAEPFVTAWNDPQRLRGVTAMLALVVFAGLYVWHFLVSPLPVLGRSGFRPHPGPRWPALARYAALAVAAAVATLLVGQSAASTWVFLAVSGIWALTGWWPYVVAVVLGAGYELAAYRLDSWERDSSLVFGLAVAIVAVTSMTIAVGRSRDLALAQRENARLAVQEERNRVARDLHDILGHSLTVIRIKSELAGRLVELDPARARAEVEAVEALAREALADVRGAVEGFREISLSGEIARARAALESAGIEPSLPRAVDGVDPDLRELYAWTVREGVTNVIRHSGASTCTVTIDAHGLRLRDDGRVPPAGPAARAGGHGLGGLAERARAAGATLTARRLDPRGFEIVVAPVPAASER
ncbi:sensor histidine kinase [Phycicoccus sonneratiae]|uniref:Histidine kinase n=1 Tax=Phycicoccus sonneratiae TaxID=2807628 RepID=A0ABS2CHU2_9MICO|nr:histidine kinase [Phycicoccus sonneraticus]MBM6399028.1 histidine kinase [Phycicoccus sonneraticus]